MPSPNDRQSVFSSLETPPSSMTVVPGRHNLPNNNQEPLEHLQQVSVKGTRGGYAPAGDCYHHHGVVSTGLVMVDPSMAEHESRASSGNNNPNEEAAASGSKGFPERDTDEDDEGWLQLSIGGRTCRDRNGRNKSGDGLERSVSAVRGSVELDLLPPGQGSGASINKLEAATSSTIPTTWPDTAMASPPLLFHHRYGSATEFPHRQPEINNWGLFRPAIHGQGFVTGAGAPTFSSPSYPPSSSTSVLDASPYFGRPLHLQIGGSSRDTIKIIDPPRRPHSGIWFMLLASQNQAKESCLPQIPKTYLRIKDGRMTVRLLTKYLVNKLELDSESEIEVTCRGQELQPYLTLQHVRDNIWLPRKDSTTRTSASTSLVATLHPESTTTTQHLMVLHYSRRRRITTPTVLATSYPTSYSPSTPSIKP